jgi:hypothetical protein
VGKVLLLFDKAAALDVRRETLFLDEAPAGINIFALLNLRAPPNATQLDGWKVIYSRNSSSYHNISTVLQVSLSNKKWLSLQFWRSFKVGTYFKSQHRLLQMCQGMKEQAKGSVNWITLG